MSRECERVIGDNRFERGRGGKGENERERKGERKRASLRGGGRVRDLKSNAYTSHVARVSARNMRYADRKLIIFLMQHIMFYTYILYI